MPLPKKQNKSNDFSLLPLDTKIEVVAIRGNEVIKREMTYGQALKLKKHKGWIYTNYQKGFCSIPENKNEEI